MKITLFVKLNFFSLFLCLIILQIQVQVRDGGDPERTARTDVRVQVKRNKNLPIFNGQINVNIPVNVKVNSVLSTISVTDSDLSGDLVYRITGDDTAKLFFDINDNGEIFLKRPLTEDRLRSLEYKIHVSVYDSHFPRDVVQATGTVQVNRNSNPPQFKSSNYDIEIAEDTEIGESIFKLQASDPDGVSY